MTRALATTGADLGAALAGFAAHVERRGAGYIACDDPEAEFTAIGHGATPEEALADLRDQLGLDDERRPIDEDEPERGGEDEWAGRILTGREQDCFTGIDEPANNRGVEKPAEVAA